MSEHVERTQTALNWVTLKDNLVLEVPKETAKMYISDLYEDDLEISIKVRELAT